MSILFIIAVLLICLLEGVPLIKKGLWPELVTFGLLIGLAIFLGVAKKLEIPTPLYWLQQLLSPVGEGILK